MRVKLLPTAVILFVLSATMAMAATPQVRASVSDRTVANVPNGEVQDSPKDLPAVARNQQRPKPRALDCVDGCPLDRDGYTDGGCNCSRICYENHSGCNLSSASIGCTAGAYYPVSCSSCSISCGW